MTLIPASLLILSAAVLVTLGGLAMARKPDSRQVPPAGTWPGVALVVPAAGAGAELPEAAAALLSQDYPFYRLIFVTRDGGDPATGIIRKAVGRDPRARHVLSGKAFGCGQKNHNLLRGVEAALEENPEILAFCDSTRIAPPHWLRALVAPVAFGEVEVSSGYHHVLPLDGRLSALGHAFSVLLLYLTKGFSLLNQPWGGGTAIRMETFERLKVTDVWARNIVDDVSLAAILNKARIRVGLSRGAWATTPLEGETMGSWIRWLFRQWFYLKVCFPLAWAAAGVYCHLFSGMLVLALFAAFGGSPGGAPPRRAGPSSLFSGPLPSSCGPCTRGREAGFSGSGPGFSRSRRHPWPIS